MQRYFWIIIIHMGSTWGFRLCETFLIDCTNLKKRLFRKDMVQYIGMKGNSLKDMDVGEFTKNKDQEMSCKKNNA